MNPQVLPPLNSNNISDIYLRQNFQNLQQYFSSQNQLMNFNFFEQIFTTAQSNFKMVHKLGTIPLDVIVTQLTGPGNVLFNFGLSDNTYLNMSATDACRVRFFVGNFWNFTSPQAVKNSDIMTFSNVSTTSTQSTKAQKVITGVATYNAKTTDGAIFVNCGSGPVSVVLPSTIIADQSSIRVEKIDSSTNACIVTVANTGTELIRAATTLKLTTQWSGQTFYCVQPIWYY